MSSFTRIKIGHKQGFTNKECLEETLTIHELGANYTIERVGDKYQLNASSETIQRFVISHY